MQSLRTLLSTLVFSSLCVCYGNEGPKAQVVMDIRCGAGETLYCCDYLESTPTKPPHCLGNTSSREIFTAGGTDESIIYRDCLSSHKATML